MPSLPLHPRNILERIATAVTQWSGTSLAFVLAAGAIVLWVILGPVFNYSDTWQLVINTGTTIITFLMVFLIQRTQNKDSMAVSAKLNELIAAMEGASNRLINIEDLSEEDVQQLHAYYHKLAELAASTSIRQSHSIEEAEARYAEKAALAEEKSTSTSRD